MSICTVRGVSTNCADRNDVTGNGSPAGIPVVTSMRRPQTLATPLRLETKYSERPSGAPELGRNHRVAAERAPRRSECFRNAGGD